MSGLQANYLESEGGAMFAICHWTLLRSELTSASLRSAQRLFPTLPSSHLLVEGGAGTRGSRASSKHG